MTKIHNYVIPGLTSELREEFDTGAKVRIFTNSRHAHHPITPHSHRFDLACLVLKGNVSNTLWVKDEENGDAFIRTYLTYMGEVGKYDRCIHDVPAYYNRQTEVYSEGQLYYMNHEEIHSILFSKGAELLVLESADKTNTTTILEPYVAGEHLPTMKIEDWMFRRGNDNPLKSQ